jgi:hypothetical protein
VEREDLSEEKTVNAWVTNHGFEIMLLELVIKNAG